MAQKEKEENFLLKYKKEIFYGIIAIITLLFIVWNSKPQKFSLVFFSIDISPIFLITFFFGMGALTVWIKYHFLMKEKDKKIKQLEEDLKKSGTSSASMPPPPVIPPPVTPPAS